MLEGMVALRGHNIKSKLVGDGKMVTGRRSIDCLSWVLDNCNVKGNAIAVGHARL